MAQPNLHQLVFQAAKEILAEGKYPTIDLICQRLSIDPQRINENISAQIQSPSDESAQDSALEVEILEVLTMMERIKEEQLENDFQPEEPPLEAEVEEQKLLDQSNNPEDVEQLVEKSIAKHNIWRRQRLFSPKSYIVTIARQNCFLNRILNNKWKML